MIDKVLSVDSLLIAIFKLIYLLRTSQRSVVTVEVVVDVVGLEALAHVLLFLFRRLCGGHAERVQRLRQGLCLLHTHLEGHFRVHDLRQSQVFHLHIYVFNCLTIHSCRQIHGLGHFIGVCQLEVSLDRQNAEGIDEVRFAYNLVVGAVIETVYRVTAVELFHLEYLLGLWGAL